MAQIFRDRGEAFRRSHDLSFQQKKAMRDIELCRTAALGGHVDFCKACGYTDVSYNSCRNRHCPKCQSLSQAMWIEQRKARILPTNYFHVVFTLPSALRPIARRAPAAIYDLLFRTASKTLLQLGRDPRRLGGMLGFTAVLHTWTRKLEFHPHLHCIVTAGALASDGNRWVPAPLAGKYLFPAKVLSRLFRGKFIAALSRLFEAGELGLDPDNVVDRRSFASLRGRLWLHEWVVYAKRPFAGAEHVYRYLGRYTHRVGISNQRLRAIDDDTVTFGTKDGRAITLTHDQFIRRFLLHVLPPHFVKIRHYGLMASSNATTKLETARTLLEAQGAPASDRHHSTSLAWQDLYQRITGVDLRKCPRCARPLTRYDLRETPFPLVSATRSDSKAPFL